MFGSVTPRVLVAVMVYGTRSPRVTFTSGVLFWTMIAPPSTGSSAMWLLTRFAEVPGVKKNDRKYCVVPAPAASAAEVAGQAAGLWNGIPVAGAVLLVCTSAGSGAAPTASVLEHGAMSEDGAGSRPGGAVTAKL